MGIGVALGVVAAMPTGCLFLAGGALGGAAGGGIIGTFFDKGLNMTNEDGPSSASGSTQAMPAVSVLTWYSETQDIADQRPD